MAGTVQRNGQSGHAVIFRPRRLVPIGGLLAIGMTLGACGSSAQPTTTTTTTTTTVAGGGGGKALVNLSNNSMGKILTTKTGLTLYYDTSDTPTKIACTGSCATVWPPLLFTGSGTPTGGAGVSGLGTIKRPGGGVQVTYKGKPLYTFASDKAGQTSGQGVAGFQVVIVGGAATGGSSTTTTSSGGGY
jgi:predicted lipoprotein with Yx(FWY)xxD motif